MADQTASGHQPAAAEICTNERVSRDNAGALRVRDAMVATPKTLPAGATARELRAMFANPHVRTALVVDGPRFVGVVQRHQVDERIADHDPVSALASRDVPTIEPNATLSAALAILDARDERRLVVLDPDGERLAGLLCLTGDRQGFCQS